MTKKIRNTKVRRTLAAVMSSIMIISAGMAVSATAVNAASLAPVTASASSTESWREKLSRSDSSVKTCVQSVKTLIDILAKKLPGGELQKTILVSYWYGIGTQRKNPLKFKGTEKVSSETRTDFFMWK